MKIINEIINDTITVIDRALDEFLVSDSDYLSSIYESMRYSLFNGGKRLRPVIAIKSFELFNDDMKKILPFACAIEMIHTYSLIHDDLPAMDNDDFRRGKPTNHKVYGEALGILAGDGLLNLAFETMLKDLVDNTETVDDYKRKSRAIYEIGRFAGVQGMIGGQVVDLTSNSDNMDACKLNYMYEKKTAGLFQAATVAGAILGGAKEDEVEIMKEFALNLGLAYQIQDDILDMSQDENINKLTHLSFYNIEKSTEDLIKFINKAYELLDCLENKDTRFLKGLTNLLVNRKI